MKVVPITTTSVEVYWKPVDMQYFSGDLETAGYRVVFQPVSDFPTALQATPKVDVPGYKVYSKNKFLFTCNIFFKF